MMSAILIKLSAVVSAPPLVAGLSSSLQPTNASISANEAMSINVNSFEYIIVPPSLMLSWVFIELSELLYRVFITGKLKAGFD